MDESTPQNLDAVYVLLQELLEDAQTIDSELPDPLSLETTIDDLEATIDAIERTMD